MCNLGMGKSFLKTTKAATLKRKICKYSITYTKISHVKIYQGKKSQRVTKKNRKNIYIIEDSWTNGYYLCYVKNFNKVNWKISIPK